MNGLIQCADEKLEEFVKISLETNIRSFVLFRMLHIMITFISCIFKVKCA